MWMLVSYAYASTVVDRTVPAAKDAAVEVEVTCGRVRITGADRADVRVHGSTDGGRAELVGGAGAVRAEVVPPPGGPACADLTVEVPAGASVEVETTSADVVVAGVTGAVEIETISGAAEVEGAVERLAVESVSGAITVRGAARRQELASVSGSVRTAGGGGRIEVETVSGAITVEAGLPLEAVELSSTSGEVVVSGALAPGGDLEARSFSGSIRATLPRDTAAAVTASSTSGTISGSLVPATGRAVSAKLGSGEGTIALTTLSGAITIDAAR